MSDYRQELSEILATVRELDARVHEVINALVVRLAVTSVEDLEVRGEEE